MTNVLRCAGWIFLMFLMDAPPGPPEENNPVIELTSTPTLGGLQYWADIHIDRDWRIQQHYSSGVCRLLDGKSRRLLEGSELECRMGLDRVLEEKQPPPAGDKVVLVLHGLIRSRFSMNALVRHLTSEGYTAYTVGYPSTRLAIEDHAVFLHKIIDGQKQAKEIHLIGHSMGGLVIRTTLAQFPDPRIRRVVMMGTPNLGAQRADTFSKVWLFPVILGPAGMQLVTSKGGIIHSLPPVAPVEVGIIAGGTGGKRGIDPFFGEDNDGIVSVASTRLPGARDFLLVPYLHAILPDSKIIQQSTAAFLKYGYFRSEELRQPIPVPKA